MDKEILQENKEDREHSVTTKKSDSQNLPVQKMDEQQKRSSSQISPKHTKAMDKEILLQNKDQEISVSSDESDSHNLPVREVLEQVEKSFSQKSWKHLKPLSKSFIPAGSRVSAFDPLWSREDIALTGKVCGKPKPSLKKTFIIANIQRRSALQVAKICPGYNQKDKLHNFLLSLIIFSVLLILSAIIALSVMSYKYHKSKDLWGKEKICLETNSCVKTSSETLTKTKTAENKSANNKAILVQLY